MDELTETLEVSGVLVQRDVYHALQNRNDVALRFLALFVFEVLVPERVGEKVQADTCGGSLKESGAGGQ